MIKLFTHTDLDGVGCAVLAKYIFGDDADITYCNYDDVNSKVEEYLESDKRGYAKCYITDISVSQEVAMKIENSHEDIYLLDHHPTALFLNKNSWANVTITDSSTGVKTSGTELFFNSLLCDKFIVNPSDNIKNFVELVRNYDTWRWTEIDNGIICKQINDLYYLYGVDDFIEWCIGQIYKEEPFPSFSNTDITVLKLKQKEIDNYITEKDKQLFTIPMCGKVCGVVFAEKYFSELGNKLCQIHPEIDFVSMIDMDGTVSYRAIKDDIDVGKDIAVLFGGGGHPKAAGSRFDEYNKLEFIKNIFEIK